MSIHVSFDVGNAFDLNNAITRYINGAAFDFIIAPLVNPLNQRNLIDSPQHSRLPFAKPVPRDTPLTRSDHLLNSYTWQTYVVGAISKWLRFDSINPHTRENARKIFKEELAWASHLGITAVLHPLSARTNARIEIPLISEERQMEIAQASSSDLLWEREKDTWEIWNRFRTLCNHPDSLFVALVLSSIIPEQSVIDRWCSEPVATIVIPTSVFLSNPSGFPVLSKAHQTLVKRFLGFGVNVVIRGNSKHNPTFFQQYIKFLESSLPPLSEIENFSKPYRDYLQSPLQPLMDNLASQTYETFEKDPIKYQRYEEAIALALSTDSFLVEKEEIVLMVLGAGRGPLVNAAMRASKSTGRKLKLFALEKNPNAVNTLRNLQRNDPNWVDVTVISTDIREWVPTELADVIVSELLGSFGDNELSPECLYGAENILKKGGISIPRNYTSFISPLSSTTLWKNALALGGGKSMETAYVVKFHAIHELSEPEACFTFVHPSPVPNPSCDRHTSLTFSLKQSALLHGFAGYFDSELYPGVNISINPPTFTTDMFSWFPLYFPLKTPLYLPPNSTLTVDFWRLSTEKKVWYEWAVSSPEISPIHNGNGKSWWIGL